jgi:2-amino-4-hydroxy-6-hydroxymethyldihydropteridine diphosphokinase
MPDARAFVGFGTNLPHKGVGGAALLAQAAAAMASAGLAPLSLSSVWRSKAWPPGADQPDFHNAVAELDPAGRTPEQVYAALRETEARLGRERRIRWGPRTLDLDLLAMDGFVGAFGELTLPHARMHERAFVLAPLAEIAPDWRHPRLGRTVKEMLAAAPDLDAVRRESAFPPPPWR